jgi:hypothetical protein
MNTDQRPGAGFGRRGAGNEPLQTHVPSAPAVASGEGGGGIAALAGIAVLTFLLVMAIFTLVRTVPGIGRINAEAAQATARVIEIVNQPVTHMRRSGQVEIFGPGWFHPGAITPDFDNVDIRATQDLLYSRFGHVSSDVNPDEMFIGSELEFNSMTKYFYVDRMLPKHRLSDDEMVEINGLYRVIGRDGRAVWMQGLLIAGLAAAILCLGAGLYYLSGKAFG